MQWDLFSGGLQGPWGRSRCGTDTSSLGSMFYAPPEGIRMSRGEQGSLHLLISKYNYKKRMSYNKRYNMKCDLHPESHFQRANS